MTRWSLAIILLLAALPAQAAVLNDFFGVEFRTGEAVLEDFSRKQLAALLQRFVGEAYGKGFRYLGDAEDFDHGHVLYFAGHGGRPVAAAVLYHTQEGAGKAHESDPGGKYDYLDARARNWIQWPDPDRPVENAARYARRSYPDTPRWNAYAQSLRGYEEAGSVVSIMLDPALIGGQVVRDVQWTFARTDCGAQASSREELRLPDGQTLCVRILP